MVKPCIMRKIILFIIIISLYAFTLNANTIKKASEILPKASDMKGGSSSWIVSGVNEEKRGRCTVYDNTYAYYSNKKEKILDIERSNTYVVSARIFDCNNFGVALDKYKELAEISKKNAKKKQIAPAPFGEQGVMVALPLKNMQGKSQQANYYVTYIFRNFVVQVYSDDGFAQMDMSGEIEKRIYEYLKSKGINYAVNKINLLINTTDNEYIDTLSFTGEQVSSVLITGIVLDINNKPVPNVSIKAMETNQETKTDSNGNTTIMRDLKENDIFSNLFFQDSEDEIYIISNGDTEIAFIDYYTILKNCNQNCPFHHKLVLTLFDLLITDNKQQNEKIELLSKRTVEEKILYFLKQRMNENNVFKVTTSYKAISEYLFVDRSNLMRELKKMEEKHLIEKHDKIIIIKESQN